MERWAKIGIGAGLIYLALLKISRSLVVGVRSFQFKSVDLTNKTVSLAINMEIKNPLIFGITITGIQGDVYMQGMKVGYVNTSYNYYLAGGHTHVLPVIVNLSIGALGDAVIQNIQTGDIRTLTIAFNGRVLAGKLKLTMPVQVELDYKDLV